MRSTYSSPILLIREKKLGAQHGITLSYFRNPRMAKIGNVLALPLKIFDTVAIKAAPAGKSKAARQGSF